MEPLFETGPSYNKHAESIVKYILSKLKNNNPKKDSKCYIRTIGFVTEIYEGRFLINKQFDSSKDKQFNTENVFDKIKECNHDWIKVKNLIVEALNNIETAMKPEKLPFNKKYVENITFSKFFNNGYNEKGEIDSPFVHFVNEPLDSYVYKSEITIGKLKEECNSLFRASAEKFCKKYFKMKNYQLSFWYSMEDWSRWFKLFKDTFPSVYNEFLICCKNGNPFDDFTDYLINTLKIKEGEKPIINHWYFRLTYQDGNELDGYFKNWLRYRIDKGTFSCLKNLPKVITCYYSNESFINSKVKNESVKKKTVVDIEDIPIF